MNNYIYTILVIMATCLLALPVSAAITTNPPLVNATCLILNGTNTGAAESVWFNYGHSTNPGFSSATTNQTKTGIFTLSRCGEPTFLPGETYKYQACGKLSGCGGIQNFTMPVLIPHALETLSIYGEDFMAHGDDPLYLAQNVWKVYSLVWGSYFMLLLIAFIFMNVTIKQRSIAMSFLLMLISGGAIFALTKKTPALSAIAGMLMALAMAGLIFWLYKRKR